MEPPKKTRSHGSVSIPSTSGRSRPYIPILVISFDSARHPRLLLPRVTHKEGPIMFTLQITKNVSAAFAPAPSRGKRANTHHSMSHRIRAEPEGEKKATVSGTSLVFRHYPDRPD